MLKVRHTLRDTCKEAGGASAVGPGPSLARAWGPSVRSMGPGSVLSSSPHTRPCLSSLYRGNRTGSLPPSCHHFVVPGFARFGEQKDESDSGGAPRGVGSGRANPDCKPSPSLGAGQH